MGVERLKTLEPILAAQVKQGPAKVVGAVYDLRSGKSAGERLTKPQPASCTPTNRWVDTLSTGAEERSVRRELSGRS
jgi:hypothetical protein